MPSLEQRVDLVGKHAIVIGGGFGIGAAVTRALADCGVKLSVCDIDGEALTETVAQVTAAGASVYSRCFDALDIAELEAFYAETAERLGHLDIVVNVVGGTAMGLFEDSGPEDWTKDIHRNFGYVLYSTRAAMPLLRKSGRGGSIINFTTIEAHRGAASIAVYAGAKAGLANFSRAMAVELGHEKIRVNSLASDLTPTRGNWNAILLKPEPLQRTGSFKLRGATNALLQFTEAERRAGVEKLPPSHFDKAIAIATPLGTAPTEDEIANSVLFLASSLSAGVTGIALHVDGGTYAAKGFNSWPFGDGFAPIPLDNTLRQLFGP